jgi:hypothetical protein
LVAVQFIDLGRIGLVVAEPFRLRASLRAAGAAGFIEGGEAVLPGRQLAGWAVDGYARWESGELHLMNFYIEGDGWRDVYDVVVRESSG